MNNRWRRGELCRRQMQVLAFVGQHGNAPFTRRMASSVLGMTESQVGDTMRALRNMGLLNYAPSAGPPSLTHAGCRMIWPFIDFK